MENQQVFQIFCRDNMTPTGISVLNVAGDCKESVIQWWKETGRDSILPMKSIQAISDDICNYVAYA